MSLPRTLGELRRSNFSEACLRSRRVKDELRQNLMARLRESDETIFPGIVVADYAGKNRFAALLQARHQILPEFVFHTAVAQTGFRKVTAAQFAERARKRHRITPEKNTFLGLYAERGEPLSGAVSVNVPVSASFLFGFRRALDSRNQLFEIRNE